MCDSTECPGADDKAAYFKIFYNQVSPFWLLRHRLLGKYSILKYGEMQQLFRMYTIFWISVCSLYIVQNNSIRAWIETWSTKEVEGGEIREPPTFSSLMNFSTFQWKNSKLKRTSHSIFCSETSEMRLKPRARILLQYLQMLLSVKLGRRLLQIALG